MARSSQESSSNNLDAAVGEATAANPPILQDNTVIQEVEFSLEGIHEHLLCQLCSGYYREPYTVTECLHTFCKSCLYYATAAGCNYCVICKIYLGNDVEKFAALDFSLQRFVDNLVLPDLVRREKQLEVQFYERQGIAMKPEFVAHHNEELSRSERKTRKDDDNNEKNGGSSRHNSEQVQSSAHDEMEVTVLPETASLQAMQQPLPQLTHPCLSVSSRLKMSQIKKYLRGELKTTSPSVEFEIMCNGVPLGDELTLGFIQRLVWAKGTDLELTYRSLCL